MGKHLQGELPHRFARRLRGGGHEIGRTKAIVRSAAKGVVGLHVLKSADGFHFKPLTDKLIITDGYFDSENLAFWDSVRGEYRAYYRDFYQGLPGSGIRGIKTATSDDFIHWTKGEWLEYPGETLPEPLVGNAAGALFV